MKSIQRREINANLALQMVGSAIQLAEQKGVEVCAVVYDPRGHMVALARTDNVMGPAIEYAIDKAWTAANFSISTQGLYERVAVKPPVAMGFANRDRVLFFPGGVPIFEDGTCIGGLGVSGSKDQDDIDIATDTIEKFGLAIKESVNLANFYCVIVVLTIVKSAQIRTGNLFYRTLNSRRH